MPDISNQFIGPLGGLLCIAFAMGCVAGWGFAMRMMGARIADLRRDCERRDDDHKDRISKLEARVKELDDFLLRGMERQLSQVRESTVRVLGPDVMGGRP